MAVARNQHEQGRDGWPLNGRKLPEKQTIGFVSPIEANPARPDYAPAADPFVEASAYTDSSSVDTAWVGGSPSGSGAIRANEGRIYGGATVPVDPYASTAEPYDEMYFDDTVLGGLHYRTAAPRQPVGDILWAGALRRFARTTAWFLPAAVLAFALASVWGWPTPTTETLGASPGTWLVVTLLGLGLWLAGVVGLAALVASTAVRPWGFVAVLATIAGTVLVAPVLGVIGLARPAALRTTDVIGADPAGSLQAQFLDGHVGRWLAVGGFALLGIGAIAAAGAILGSRVLNRIDGWLVLLAVAIAAGGAYLSWEFMLTLAAMVMLAATLGLAWTVSRLSSDGGLTGAD
jgi:Amt family ammonium transporter